MGEGNKKLGPIWNKFNI